MIKTTVIAALTIAALSAPSRTNDDSVVRRSDLYNGTICGFAGPCWNPSEKFGLKIVD
jgi:hypothetical protein